MDEVAAGAPAEAGQGGLAVKLLLRAGGRQNLQRLDLRRGVTGGATERASDSCAADQCADNGRQEINIFVGRVGPEG